MTFKRVCTLDDVWEGEMEEFEIDGTEVLIVHADGGEVRAYQARCPHQDHPLVEGSLEENVLTCSAHLWQFDVITGKGVNPEGCMLRRFSTKIENEEVWVDLTSE